MIVQPEKENSSTTDLLRKALNKFANDEYHGIVENPQIFVGKFNERCPEFKERLGLHAIMFNAEQLNKKGG